MKSLRFKIFLLFCALLALTLAVVLATIYTSMREQVQRGIDNQLQVGRQVFLSQFQSRRDSLSLYSHLIGRDFGLLSTLQDDPKSLLVAVNNHRMRADADLAIVTDDQGRILADTVRPEVTGEAFDPAAETKDGTGGESVFLNRGGRTFQVVSAPLLAPNPVGRIYLGFLVDDALAEQFADITSLRVAFARTEPGSPEIVASTLSASEAAQLAERLVERGDGQPHVGIDGETFVHETVPLSGGASPVEAVLLYSRDRAMAVYQPWWQRTAEISAVVFLLGLAGAWAVARNVVRPVRMLVSQARAVAGGRYERPITVKSSGEIGELVTEFNRMQGAIAEREASIRFSAYHDALTGLVNRNRLERLIDQRLGSRDVRSEPLGVLIADLNRFKDINETLGYKAGDRLLVKVSQRISEALDEDDIVGRLGGDEFGIVLSEFAPGRVNERLDAICDAIARPYDIDGLALHVTASVGCAVHPDHGHEASVLLRRADTACSRAKERHRRYALYEESDSRYSLLRVSLLGELQSAIERGDLVLHYQPKLGVRGDRVAAAEALVRWEHPQYGLIPPSEFIPMVEYTGNIHMLTFWVLDEALRQLDEWRDEGIDLRIAVNISADDLGYEGFVTRVREALDRHGLPPGVLTLEVTESAVVGDAPRVARTLDLLSRLGVGLGIDDYGTGYSSLGQLKHLPVNELKIDKSFVLDLEHSPDDQIIVRSTIDLGHTMGLDVAAEGVETAEAERIVRELGCDLIQGHRISAALPAPEFRAWLLARGWMTSAIRGS